MEPQKETVIVTGSSGYIGRAVIEKLAGQFNLVGLDLKIPEDASPAAQYFEIDLTSDESVEAVLQQVRSTYGERIASVIHLAAYFDLTGEPNPKYEAVTVRGTERLLRGLQSLQVEQFVFASTLLVHAPTKPGQRIDEDWPLDPKLPYPASKFRTEALIHEQRGSIPAVFIRPAGIYDDRCHAVFLAQQIARIYERRLISHVYPGDIDTGQPFLHLDDLTDALLRIIQRRRELPPELPLLLGEPETPTFRQLQSDLGQLIHGEDWETRTVPKAVAKSGTCSDAVQRVTAERNLWEPALRSRWLAWSDLISGLLIMLFGTLSLSQRLAWAQWANTVVGIWLLFVPLIFWSPSAAVYANDWRDLDLMPVAMRFSKSQEDLLQCP